ncbi:uncharacterized protein ASCRUDRAFT_71166 [Ascoidea rubescens DSM 1968]|uniref:Extracellular membrane protein CFEM domain-containing protein n=1 Tax=Ascoidea rubescens DSM 1968 TaxID=1344418 RepID=A0A1D2VF32_9ASCO|nr:hypothetical protein ASCRUDRAFT_71166 [Ascoidea rubescens DSM 1968]ODV60130.1 hypothetical protein ASCRUDRAFT_71166 [Ascoidea rubescens DSM 1968]
MWFHLYFNLYLHFLLYSLVATKSLAAYTYRPDIQNEFGSYMNPNPRTPCEGSELEKLNTCANDVLSKLDDCKADDLACECCALQSLNRDCYGLCPGSPSGNFLAVLYDDCESLNDVNACGLPFKKEDAKPISHRLNSNSKSKSNTYPTNYIHHNTNDPIPVLKSTFESKEKVKSKDINKEKQKITQDQEILTLKVDTNEIVSKNSKNSTNSTIISPSTNINNDNNKNDFNSNSNSTINSTNTTDSNNIGVNTDHSSMGSIIKTSYLSFFIFFFSFCIVIVLD